MAGVYQKDTEQKHAATGTSTERVNCAKTVHKEKFGFIRARSWSDGKSAQKLIVRSCNQLPFEQIFI